MGRGGEQKTYTLILKFDTMYFGQKLVPAENPTKFAGRPSVTLITMCNGLSFIRQYEFLSGFYYCTSLCDSTDNYLSLQKSWRQYLPTRNAIVDGDEWNSNVVVYTQWHDARKKFGENRSNFSEAEYVNLPSKWVWNFTRIFTNPLYLSSHTQRTESRWTQHNKI